MSFERKIAGLGLPEVQAPTVEPTEPQKAGTLTISGGGVSVKDRGHKDWGQTINQGFELRSLMTTQQYWQDSEEAVDSFDFMPGEFGYSVFRAKPSGGALTINLTKPDGVPSSQHTPTGKFRYRQRWGFLEIYYPEDTTLSFGPDYAFTTAAWKADLWEQADLALLIGEDSPITYAMLAKGVIPQRLDELLAEGPRLAGTSDLFLISYNERTGKATVVLLSGPAGMEGMDPQVPDPDSTEPVDDTDVEEPTSPPWEKPREPKPGAPDPGTSNEYTDPTTGLPITPTPPPAQGGGSIAPNTAGAIYALHSASLSVSLDGGSTWAPINVSGAGALVDLVATPAGLFLLDDTGQVFTTQSISEPFQLVRLTDTSTSESEIPVINGDFETGDLTGWTSVGLSEPRVLRTVQPPQLPDSTHYLTRDWGALASQPYKIVQSITVPDGATDLEAVVQCYCAEATQIGTLRVTSQDDVAVPTGRNTFSGNACLNFARSPEGEALDLYVTSGEMGVFDGSNGSTGTRTFELRRRSDGTVYNRPVFLSIGDLDSHEQMRFQEAKVLEWFVQPGSSIATFTTAGLRYFTTTADNQNGGVILSDGAFAIHLVTNASSIGLSGSPRPEWINKTTVEAVASRTAEWHELRAPLPEAAGSLLVIELEAEGDPADVYFDNVQILAKQDSQAPQVLAIASVEGDRGGAELYLDGGLLRYVADPAERGAFAEVPASDITIADHAPNGVRLASNGSQAWYWADGTWGEPIEGPFTSAIADPAAFLVLNGDGVLNGLGEELVSLPTSVEVATPAWHLAGDRRREGTLATEATCGDTFGITPSGVSTSGARQPISEAVIQRRSIALDSGRILGWSVGSPDLFWTSDLTVPWNVAGALAAPIIKIVELR